MIVPVMAISNLVLTQQIYSEETNDAHAHYREPVPLTDRRGAAGSLTEISLKSPFLCVKGSPTRYGFRAGAKAFLLYSRLKTSRKANTVSFND